jgi:hypothetical protein
MTAAAFFDMDKTLLRVESGMSWTKFLYRRGELPTRMVAKAIYWSTLYKLAILDMETVFTRLCRDLEGDLEADMLRKCAVWYQSDLASMIASRGRAAIAEHRRPSMPPARLRAAPRSITCSVLAWRSTQAVSPGGRRCCALGTTRFAWSKSGLPNTR